MTNGFVVDPRFKLCEEANFNTDRPPWRSPLGRSCFASISQGALAHLPQFGPEKRQEPATQQLFPERFCCLKKEDCPVLTGFG